MQQLAAAERRAGLPASDVPSPAGRFADLLEALHERTGERVVVLVDEYDKPILNALEGPAPATEEHAETPLAANAQAAANRDDLRGLYGTLKDCDAHVERTFITGVSKFSKLSLFSGLNFLTDLTLDPRSTPSSRPSSRASTATRSAPGTTATTGGGKSASTTPGPYSTCSRAASSRPTGSRPPRPASSSTPCWVAASRDRISKDCSPTTTCCPPSTWSLWRPRRCCSRPAT